MYYIYLITNLINGKQYCGKRFFDGKPEDDNYFGSGICIRKSKLKYGIENFSKSIIQDNIPYELIDDYERYYIDYLNTKVPFGYNLTDGGDGGDVYKYMSEEKYETVCNKISKSTETRYKNIEERIKTSESLKGKEKSIDHCNHISESRKGKESNFKGCHHTEESKQILSEIMKDKFIGDKNPFYGKHHTDEQKKRQSEIMKSKIPWNKGKKQTKK